MEAVDAAALGQGLSHFEGSKFGHVLPVLAGHTAHIHHDLLYPKVLCAFNIISHLAC